MTDAGKLISRAAAIALLLGLLSGLYLLAIEPILAARRMLHQSLSRTTELALRYERVGAAGNRLETKIQEFLKRQTESGIYLIGETEALAAARLQQMVNARIKANRGRVRRIQILPMKMEQGSVRVAISVTLEAPMSALQRIVHSFEANRPMVFVQGFEIKGRRSRQWGKQAADPILFVRLKLAGYMRPETG